MSSVYFSGHRVQPHLSVGLISVRQKGGLPGPPPRNPPSSIPRRPGALCKAPESSKTPHDADCQFRGEAKIASREAIQYISASRAPGARQLGPPASREA